VVVSEQRPELPLGHAGRVIFLEDGRVVDELPPAWTSPPDRPAGRGLGAGEEIVRLEGVSFAYPGGPPVVAGESLTVRQGEIVALVGPNGVGKTTIAKLAAGLLSPGGGRIVRFGDAAYLSQDPGRYLVAETVLEEAALAAPRERARARLEQLGLAAHEQRHPRDLSSGERERLALACVLAVEPQLLVLDEPTRGVDPERKVELAELLRAEAGRRATLVVTHDRWFARAVADRTVALGREEVLV
jgi:energy-coupling factor transport system ATP-binding protein